MVLADESEQSRGESDVLTMKWGTLEDGAQLMGMAEWDGGQYLYVGNYSENTDSWSVELGEFFEDKETNVVKLFSGFASPEEAVSAVRDYLIEISGEQSSHVVRKNPGGS